MRVESATAESRKHYDFFDSMRNITMVCVVLYHAVIAYSSTTPQFPIHDSDPKRIPLIHWSMSSGDIAGLIWQLKKNRITS